MAYLGTYHIDDYVGIPAATHQFSSGAAYAPTVLTYSIYEEATAVGIDEDVDMVVASPFDAIVGCYWVRRQLTAAAGFEAGKNYMVVVKATVDGVSAIQMHTFQVESAYATASALATVDANVDSVLTDTAEIGAAGAGLTALGDARLANLDAAVSSRSTYAGGAVASVTGNVGGNVTGSVGSVVGLTPANLDAAVSTRAVAGDQMTLQNDAITAAKVAANAIGASELAADAVQEIADQVWDELLAGHPGPGSTGEALAAAGAAGDPWITPLPGAYAAGTAGYILGTNLDAVVSACCEHGAGAYTFTYTLTSDVDGTPIDEADVWVTSDLAGTNVLASGRTNMAGQVVFFLDAGVHYVWRQRDGWDFVNPDIEVIP